MKMIKIYEAVYCGDIGILQVIPENGCIGAYQSGR